MYVLYKSKNILTLITIGYIVGFLVGMCIEYCLWAQVAVLNHKLLYWTVWDRFMQVMYLGRAPRTKETLPDFREKSRVIRHSRVFRGLTGSQQTPGDRGVTAWYQSLGIRIPRELGLGIHHHLGGSMLGIGMRLPRKITGQNKDTTCTCVEVFYVIC